MTSTVDFSVVGFDALNLCGAPFWVDVHSTSGQTSAFNAQRRCLDQNELSTSAFMGESLAGETIMCRRFSLLILALPLFTACSLLVAPLGGSPGMSRSDLIAHMGQPERVRSIEGGSLLEFPGGPFGKQTWFVSLDAAGKVVRSEQVLTEKNFNRIEPGMSREEVRNLLGRPGEVQMLGRARGVVWSYRYENAFCNWFQVEISQQQQVRSAGNSLAPECDGPDDRSAK